LRFRIAKSVINHQVVERSQEEPQMIITFATWYNPFSWWSKPQDPHPFINFALILFVVFAFFSFLTTVWYRLEAQAWFAQFKNRAAWHIRVTAIAEIILGVALIGYSALKGGVVHVLFFVGLTMLINATYVWKWSSAKPGEGGEGPVIIKSSFYLICILAFLYWFREDFIEFLNALV
jgi:hypothetical protein